MAEVVLPFVLERLGEVLEQIQLCKDVRQQVQCSRDELKRMQCFLKDADAKEEGDMRVRNWVSDVRNVAYDVEDLIDTYVFKLESLKRTHFIKRHAFIFREWKLRSKISNGLESIHLRISDISISRETYGIKNVGEATTPANEKLLKLRRTSARAPSVNARRLAIYSSYDCFFENSVPHLRSLRFFRVNNQSCSSDLFSICRKFKLIKVLDLEDMKLDAGVPDEIGELFHLKYLGLRHCNLSWLPKGIGSLSNLQTLDIGENCNLRTLPNVLWKLKNLRHLYKNAYPFNDLLRIDTLRHLQTLSDLEVEDWKQANPAHLINLRKLGLRGSFSRDKNKIFNSLSKLMSLQSLFLHTQDCVFPSLSQLSFLGRVIKLHLRGGIAELPNPHEFPPNLTQLILHQSRLSNDPMEILKKLPYLFVLSRGTYGIKNIGEGTSHANETLLKLRRSSPRGQDSNIVGLEEDIAIIVNQLVKDNQRVMNFLEIRRKRNSVPPAKTRHLAVCSSSVDFLENSDPHLRSLLFFQLNNESCVTDLRLICRKFKLVKVLELEGTWLKYGGIPNVIGELFHLKYLGLRRCELQSLPEGIGSLSNLQTLDVAENFDLKTVPNVLWKLKNLRHLYMDASMFGNQLRIDTLRHLQTLSDFRVKDWKETNTINLINLRKLGLRGNFCIEKDKIFNSLSKLLYLQSLFLHTDEDYIFPSLKLSSLRRVIKLQMIGVIRNLPRPDEFPPRLTQLILHQSRLSNDPMKVLKELPFLFVLRLKASSYSGKTLQVSVDGFRQLEFLELELLECLEEFNVEENALPKLRSFQLTLCRHLRMLPEEIKSVTTLSELEIKQMPNRFVERLQGEDYYKIQHVPSITILKVV
ncbi:hypothetical protein FEM48_Zijuj03G0134400 [Ziziphus jujuba var. spinosa]|uniref:Uncharacterized protein n=1 Tax=Ziziphus jujuba var. spinosa TaxID=714518 RepID=A0A978VQK1_ZIZJJ|nr:hypothetical protein FEM48_Zijuj03G0134400 [Ziziphus jujuba var. spinosa]